MYIFLLIHYNEYKTLYIYKKCYILFLETLVYCGSECYSEFRWFCYFGDGRTISNQNQDTQRGFLLNPNTTTKRIISYSAGITLKHKLKKKKNHQ